MRRRNSTAGKIRMELADRLRALAIVAADRVEPGMIVGLGTGSTADAVIRELGRRRGEGLVFTGVATSSRTEALARELGIPLTTLEEVDAIDLGIDGADEIDPNLDAIKGRGGALLREKLVALACADYVLVATTEKSVDRLGANTPLPVEIVAFAWMQTAGRLRDVGFSPTLRPSSGDPSLPATTDGGGFILDCATGAMADPGAIAARVKAIPGVIEHGLFHGIARSVLQVDPDGAVVRRVRGEGLY